MSQASAQLKQLNCLDAAVAPGAAVVCINSSAKGYRTTDPGRGKTADRNDRARQMPMSTGCAGAFSCKPKRWLCEAGRAEDAQGATQRKLDHRGCKTSRLKIARRQLHGSLRLTRILGPLDLQCRRWHRRRMPRPLRTLRAIAGRVPPNRRRGQLLLSD